MGLGAFAMAAASALVRYTGGTPAGIDIRKVLEALAANVDGGRGRGAA